MADIYVRSTDGSDADNGTTWALAKATLVGAAAIDAAGDTIYLSQSHAETGSGAVTVALAGTMANPVKVIACNDGATPPTAVSSAAITTTYTNTNGISISGSYYAFGIDFVTGAAISPANQTASNSVMLDTCAMTTTSTASAGVFNLGSTNNVTQKIVLKDCTYKFGHVNNVGFLCYGIAEFKGGSFNSASSTPAAGVFAGAGDRTGSRILIDGLDMSNLASTVNIFRATASPGLFMIRNSKLPASWSGSLCNAAPLATGQRFEMHNCDSGDTNYRLWVQEYSGSIKTETTLVRTGGASDGVTDYSLVMASTANANATVAPLVSPEISIWNDAVGSSKTVTVEILHDSATNLTDGEIWLEVQYLGTSGVPLGSFVSDAKANILATAADQATSSETWTTTGMTNPNKQKLSVTFTPQEAGYLQAKVYLAKASKTVYVDPKLTVS
jgi:hypothetical protein